MTVKCCHKKMEKFNWRQFNVDWRHKKRNWRQKQPDWRHGKMNWRQIKGIWRYYHKISGLQGGSGYSPTRFAFRAHEMRILRRSIERPLPKGKEIWMARPKGENVIRKHFKLTEETARVLEECSKVENMNESEYIRYLLLNQSETLRSRELELEIMHLRNEINKIGVNINQIVKNNNSHMYKDRDKSELKVYLEKIMTLLKTLIEQLKMA